MVIFLSSQISDISAGKDANPNTTKEVAQELEEALNRNMTNSSSSDNGINPGNLNASLEAIDQISMVHQMFDEPPSWDEVMVTNTYDLVLRTWPCLV